MQKAISFSLCLGLLTACGDGNPFVFGVTETPIKPPVISDSGVPEKVQGNVGSVTFVAGAPTITVQITSLDQGTFDAVHNRNPALNVPGYQAYTYQDDPLDRMFVAIVAESRDAAIQAATVMDGGQFTKFFGGTGVTQIGTYGADTGLVSYAGTYAGLSNINAPGAELLPVPPGTDPAILPAQPTRVTGDVFINADFTDNTINGAITNRELTEYGTAIPDIFLIPGDIAADGTFEGSVEIGAQTGVGNYAGVFGGTGATSVGGGVLLDGDFIPGVENEQEYGIFVLAQCGTPGDAPICAGVN